MGSSGSRGLRPTSDPRGLLPLRLPSRAGSDAWRATAAAGLPRGVSDATRATAGEAAASASGAAAMLLLLLVRRLLPRLPALGAAPSATTLPSLNDASRLPLPLRGTRRFTCASSDIRAVGGVEMMDFATRGPPICFLFLLTFAR